MKILLLSVVAVAMIGFSLLPNVNALQTELEVLDIEEYDEHFLVKLKINIIHQRGDTISQSACTNLIISSLDSSYILPEKAAYYKCSPNSSLTSHDYSVFPIIKLPKDDRNWKIVYDYYGDRLMVGSFSTPDPTSKNYTMGEHIPLEKFQPDKFADFQTSNIRLKENSFFDVLYFDVDVTMKLDVKDTAIVLTHKTWIIGDGESYKLDRNECDLPLPAYQLSGKQGGIGKYGVCYSLDKHVENVSVVYDGHIIDKIFLDELRNKNISYTDLPKTSEQISSEILPQGGGCLIATAAFGSEMAPQVQFLRELRDNTVMSTQSGTTFMNGFNQFYYSFSPQIADYERENPVFKEAVKVTLTPLLTSLTLLNYVEIDSEKEMLGYGIGIILLNVGMYFVAPAVLIIALKNRLKN